jgi:hypothetical protein
MKRPKIDPYFIQCGLCDQSRTAKTGSEMVGWYLLHTIRDHWDVVEMAHSAHPDSVNAVFMIEHGLAF